MMTLIGGYETKYIIDEYSVKQAQIGLFTVFLQIKPSGEKISEKKKNMGILVGASSRSESAKNDLQAVSTRTPGFSSVKDLGGASTEDAVTRGSKEHFFVQGMGDLNLLFEFEGEDDEEEDNDILETQFYC
uniref:Uncharacterized protein n=1 Tax=Romanomermis culicivorax TaxID=13658 RepID=A0A915L620_ROMCU